MEPARSDSPQGGPPSPRPVRHPDAPIDAARYRKLRRFVGRVLAHAVFWDLLLARAPLLRRLRRPPLPRWQALAAEYRQLAIEMGGVLIKLGQFLSARVDVLPREITSVLAGLQDEVPEAPFAAVVAALEADLARPLGEAFLRLEPTPIGSASLAQVHAAILPGGERAVVKVLRPGIEVLVETDLAAVALAARWLKVWRPLARRVDLERLVAEFASTTRRELDLIAEGHSAERFAGLFAEDPAVRVPGIHWPLSGGRCLTMEDVGFLKIADLPALDAAGISRPRLARTLFGLYLRQIFIHRFVHADPHPGNLFVHPLAPAEGAAPGGDGRPFQLAFVDFGMVTEIPDRLRAALREAAIAVGTRDAWRLVRAYRSADILLAGADLGRLEEIHQELFERFWGLSLAGMREAALGQARDLAWRYRDLIVENPFQMPVELLFTGRAVGLLAGLATHLDPGFDPWGAILPFARELAHSERWGEAGGFVEGVLVQAQALARLPERADRVLMAAQRGRLVVQATLAPDARRLVERLERAVRRLTWAVAAGVVLVLAVQLAAALPAAAWPRWTAAGAALALVLAALRRS